jgi:hypothetical protein
LEKLQNIDVDLAEVWMSGTTYTDWVEQADRTNKENPDEE